MTNVSWLYKILTLEYLKLSVLSLQLFFKTVLSLQIFWNSLLEKNLAENKKSEFGQLTQADARLENDFCVIAC